MTVKASRTLHLVAAVSREGTEHQNEDRWGHAGRAVWVIDGATPLSDPFEIDGLSSAAWWAERLADAIRRHSLASTSWSPTHLEIVREECAALLLARVPDAIDSPSASTSIASYSGHTLDVLLVGDTGATLLFTDGRSIDLPSPLATLSVHDPASEIAVPWTQIPDRLVQRRSLLEDDRGAWTLAARPLAPGSTASLRLDAAVVDRILLYSDGLIDYARAKQDDDLAPAAILRHDSELKLLAKALTDPKVPDHRDDVTVVSCQVSSRDPRSPLLSFE